MGDLSPAPPLAPERERPAIDPFAGWVPEVPAACPLGPAKAAPYGEEDLRRTRRGGGPRRIPCDGPRARAGVEADAEAVARRWPPRARLGAGDHAGRLRQLRCRGRGQEPRARAARARAPQSRSRYCVATRCERAECFCEGLAGILGPVGGVPRAVAPGDATEAGRMPFGRAAESRLSSRTRARHRLGPRFRDPRSGGGRGSAGDAVGLPRGNLLVPVPSVASVAGPDARPHVGCKRTDPASRNKSGEPATKAFPVDFAAMMSLPGVRLDSAGWLGARSDKRGYVRIDGNSHCAGPAWHDRGLVVGVRANSVSIFTDRNRRVATLPRCRGEGPSEAPSPSCRRSSRGQGRPGSRPYAATCPTTSWRPSTPRRATGTPGPEGHRAGRRHLWVRGRLRGGEEGLRWRARARRRVLRRARQARRGRRARRGRCRPDGL